MITAHDIQLQAPLRGLRLHPRHPKAGSKAAVRVTALLDLKEREARRTNESHQLVELVRAARKLVADVPALVGTRLDEVAGIAVELGLQIAREIVGNALDRGLVDPTPTVARCLRDCVHGSDRGDLVVRLHPEDLALVQTRLLAMPELQEEIAASRFVADATVARGGVRAETDAGRLRHDPADALARVCAEVRREVSG